MGAVFALQVSEADDDQPPRGVTQVHPPSIYEDAGLDSGKMRERVCIVIHPTSAAAFEPGDHAVGIHDSVPPWQFRAVSVVATSWRAFGWILQQRFFLQFL